MTDTAPAVQVVDLTVDDEPTKPELSNATTYCCGRHHCCCGRCRFACNPKRKKICVALAVVLAAAAAAIIICAVYFTWPKPGTAIRVQHVVGSPSSISTLTTAAVGGRRLLQQQSTVLLSPHSAVQSATNNAYAQVDALTLNVAYIRFASVSGGGHDLASTSWGPSQTFVLRSGSNTVPLTATVQNMAPGPYFAADLVFWNRWSIQAFCRTANSFMYTTPNGVVSLPSTPTFMPSDYGPLLYDNMPGVSFTVGTDSASNTAAQGHMSFINSVYPYTVTKGSTVTLFVDATDVVSCYDGTSNASATYANGGSMIYPMGFDQSYGPQGGPQFTVPFNWASPQFGFSSWTLPVFVQVESNGGDSTAVGETYAFARNASLLPTQGGAPVDWGRLVIGTLTWSDATPSATLLDMRTRMTGSSTDFGVQGGFDNFTATTSINGGSVWSFTNGQQFYWSYLYMDERIFSGFTRTVDFTTVGSLTVSDGPQCNQSPGGPSGSSQPNPCTGTTTTFFYVQVPRTT